MTDCPDDTELAGFLNDSLGADRLAGVSGHVDGCPRCQVRLDRLTEQSDGAVARYRELSSGELPNAASDGIVSPEAVTQILSAKPVVPGFGGLPQVPGFEIVAEIGRGGMGVVYRARHRRLNRLVALKMILAGGAADPLAVQRFLFEGEALARVQHPQVVTVFEVDTYDGPNGAPVPYLAMELLEGGSLSRRLRGGPAGPAQRFAPRAAAELIEGLARAVHAAHLQGVVHRDLKPGNILFPAEPGLKSPGSGTHEKADPPPSHAPRSAPGAPKVTDFGLAKFTQDAGAELTRSGQIVGTPQYMAPEQAAGARTMGPAVDVYALGVILFECLAGRPPFTGTEPMSVMLKVIHEPPKDVRALCPDVPRDLAAVTMKCLAKEPERRYASADALADDLARFLEGRPTQARPVTHLERLRLSARRNPTVAALLGALALALTAAFVSVAVLWVRAEKQARAEEQLRQWAEGRERTEKELRQAAQDASARARGEIAERQRHEARLEFAQAVELCEDGRVAEGLTQFVNAVELADATGDARLARAARINLGAWALALPKPPRRFKHTEQPRLVAFHPDGKHMVSAGRGRELYLWDTAAPAEPVRTYTPAPAPRALFGAVVGLPTYWAVAISPDGRRIAAGGTDGAVTLWDTTEKAPRASFPLPEPKADPTAGAELDTWTLAFTDDHVLWTCDGANGLRRWDVT
ncbi:MAG TPA: serine/threonine-protein kinase, partial [Gemmata sp.]